ncbi:Alpha/Beta hydrolase protein [Umbelopsis sp. AD052]|nr:Alpha/Beta hydrolase protein [Umbelopsis sp. AD052]
MPSWLSYTLSATGLASAAGAVMLYLYQSDLLYLPSHPEGSRTEVPKPSQYGMPYVEETLTTKDGVKIKSYIITLKDEHAAKNAPTIIYHHANAGNMGHRLPIAQVFYEKFNANVVMLSYRGYGLSEGSPSDKGLRIDSQTMLDYVRAHPILGKTKIIAYGQSLGGAVAIDVVARNPDAFAGLMIENTFLSVPKMIPHVVPMLKNLTWLCHLNWPSENNIRQIVKTPILFLSGAKDELVPPSHMKGLYNASQTRATKVWKEFANGTHNDTCIQPGYFSAIRDFLADIRDDQLEPVQQQAAPSKTDKVKLQGEGEEKFQLVSGVADAEGMTHSFRFEEEED